MTTNERKYQSTEKTSARILEAARKIIKGDGLAALNMRRIADEIGYTVPVIYGCFLDKSALLAELSRKGFIQLASEMREAKEHAQDPSGQLEAIWMAYWSFSRKESALYQLMFGVATSCCMPNNVPEGTEITAMLMDVTRQFEGARALLDAELHRKHQIIWAFFHGLISLKMVAEEVPEEVSQLLIKDAVAGLVRFFAE